MLEANLVYAKFGNIALRYLGCFSCSLFNREVLNTLLHPE